jgi:hypothetical protein
MWHISKNAVDVMSTMREQEDRAMHENVKVTVEFAKE